MVLRMTAMTWQDAQKFCRDHYTDLAIIRSQADLNQITSLLTAVGSPVWIGLYRDNWKWSDQVNIASSAKLAIQTFTPYNENCGGADIYYHTTDDKPCTSNYFFYCSTVKKKRQVIRVQVKSGQNVDEAKLQALVLNKLKQTLSNEDVTLTWRTQPD
ncbi:hypothetical protein QQF64_031138 [Cirrhinus molitorella]|uniref:C-type lectin domain-containing protein n=1 Tax=Cirrhinus molitorella TaxID=172907 RepID=A0ABR3N5M7_9TELE